MPNASLDSWGLLLYIISNSSILITPSHWVCTCRYGTLSQRMGFLEATPGVGKHEGWRRKDTGITQFPIIHPKPLTRFHPEQHDLNIFAKTILFSRPQNTTSLPWFPHNHKESVTSRCGFLTRVNGSPCTHRLVPVHPSKWRGEPLLISVGVK